NSTSSSEPGPSSSFQPVLPPGQNPAYDAALSYLSSHCSSLLSQITHLRSTNAPAAQIEHLEIAADVNDPLTRRTFRETGGKGMMGQAVMRHLAERAWKKEGGLDLLMQRIHQMGVVPDLVPELKGTAPLTIRLEGEEVEPGSMQSAAKWGDAPNMSLQLFHHPEEGKEEGLYTLLVVNTDHPSPETQSFVQRVLYAKSDIPLSVQSGETDLFTAPGTTHLEWEPPLPAKGTGKHRYAFIVLRQPSSSSPLTDRSPFNLRTHLSSASLSSADIVGISLIRSEWTKADETYLADKYREVHGGEMVEFGKPPKEMRFGYPMSANQKRAEAIREEAWDRAVGGLAEGL
ncbi:phosphatidylethanolamine-binding protein, partial [Dioszegia hungarica]